MGITSMEINTLKNYQANKKVQQFMLQIKYLNENK